MVKPGFAMDQQEHVSKVSNISRISNNVIGIRISNSTIWFSNGDITDVVTTGATFG